MKNAYGPEKKGSGAPVARDARLAMTIRRLGKRKKKADYGSPHSGRK